MDTDTVAGVLVVVTGEADIATAPQLREELRAVFSSEARAWTVDLEGLSFCGMMGLDALRDAERTAGQAGSVVCWRGVSQRLRWLAETFPARAAIPAMRVGGSASAT